MKKYWLADKSISLSTAKTLIENQFPQLKPLSIQLIGEGWDNRVFQVNQNLTFRFPRRQVAVKLLETEGVLLPEIAHLLPHPIPVPRFYGQPTVDFKWPFLGYSHIAGQTISSQILSREQRGFLSKPLAHFLKALHAIDLNVFKHIEIPGDTIERMNLAKQMDTNIKRLEQALTLGLIDEELSIRAILNATPIQRTQTQRCLVHGDFQSRQILVNSNSELSGVIDWGDIHAGDPCLDLSIIYSLLPPESLVDFQNIYGSIDKETLLLARFRATHLGLVLLLYGHDINNNESFSEGQRILRFCCESFNQDL